MDWFIAECLDGYIDCLERGCFVGVTSYKLDCQNGLEIFFWLIAMSDVFVLYICVSLLMSVVFYASLPASQNLMVVDVGAGWLSGRFRLSTNFAQAGP